MTIMSTLQGTKCVCMCDVFLHDLLCSLCILAGKMKIKNLIEGINYIYRNVNFLIIWISHLDHPKYIV